jgi:hypothetical protein
MSAFRGRRTYDQAIVTGVLTLGERQPKRPGCRRRYDTGLCVASLVKRDHSPELKPRQSRGADGARLIAAPNRPRRRNLNKLQHPYHLAMCRQLNSGETST